MFRLQNNVPEVYVKYSRDFQLLCRLYDACFGGVKSSIDSISTATSFKECDSSLLELAKTKIGLFNVTELDDYELRCLMQAFPTLLRYKGSKQALRYIQLLYARMYSNTSLPNIEVDIGGHNINVIFTEYPKNPQLILDLLQYIAPAGFIVSMHVSVLDDTNTSIKITDELSLEEIESPPTLNKQDISLQIGVASLSQRVENINE